jgi:hypothetical protein
VGCGELTPAGQYLAKKLRLGAAMENGGYMAFETKSKPNMWLEIMGIQQSIYVYIIIYIMGIKKHDWQHW